MPPRLAVGRTAELFAWENGRVLKLFNAGVSGAAADHEADISRVVYETGLPVPAVFGRVDLNGRAGILYEQIYGPTLLSCITRQPLKTLGWGRTLARLHFQVHQAAANGLADKNERLERIIQGVPDLPDELRMAALARLKQLPAGGSLLHGDFHPDNILASPRGLIIIDWLDASRGHPLADVARTWLLMTGTLPPTMNAGERATIQLVRGVLVRAYLNSYLRFSGFGMSDLRPWLLPVAAARLSEDVPGDRARLLPLMRRWM
jgi:hypothetical protein